MFERLRNIFRRESKPEKATKAQALAALNSYIDSLPADQAQGAKLMAQSFEAYEWASREPPRDAYQPHPYSGDAAILTSYDLLGRRIRDAVRNDGQSKKIVNALADLIVGKGFQTFSWPFGPSEFPVLFKEIDEIMSGEGFGPRISFAMETDDLFDEYASDPEQIDFEGRLNWEQMQQMMIGDSITAGSCFLVTHFKENYKTVPLCFQILEKEQLNTSLDRPSVDYASGFPQDEYKIVGGVEMTRDNRVVAYHFYLDHPQEFFSGQAQSILQGTGSPVQIGQRPVRIPADRVIDLSLFHRPSAHLGISWFDAIGQDSFDLKSYRGSEIQAAALASLFILVAKLVDGDHQVPNDFFTSLWDATTNQGGRSYQLGNSPAAQVIRDDEELDMIRSERPNPTADRFIKCLNHAIAGGVGLSYYSLTGDYERTNFSSARAAKLDEDGHIAPLQNWFASTVCLPVRSKFQSLAASMGLLSVSAKEYESARTYKRMDAIGPGRQHLDPRNEVEAEISELRSGMKTFKQVCAKRSAHWLRQLIQIAIERRIMAKMEISLDWSKNSTAETTSGQVGERVEEEEQVEEAYFDEQ